MNKMKKGLLAIFLSFTALSLIFSNENKGLYSEEDISIENYLQSNTLKKLEPIKPLKPKPVEPVTIKEEKNLSEIIIKTNIPGVKVYINGELKGLTPLSIVNLLPGQYQIKLEKTGYQTESQYIRVSKNTKYSYYFEMTEIRGFVELQGLPEKSIIYADGNSKSNSRFELAEGYHTITVRCFCYQDFSSQIYVQRNKIKILKIQMEKAEQKITDFYANQKTINPAYSGSLGKFTFIAKVTTKGSGRLSITNQMGNEVYSFDFPEFTSWNQEAEWDGKDKFGNEVLSGDYTATFSCENLSKSIKISVDKNLIYPLNEIGSGGSSIGSVITGSILPPKTMMLEFSAMPMFSSKTGFHTLPLNIGLSAALNKHFEFSGKFTAFAGLDTTPKEFSMAIKAINSTNNTEEGLNLRYGASLHYGYCSKAIYQPYKADFGAGLGIAGLLGFQTEEITMDYSSEYILGVKSSNPFNGDNTWKNGLAISYMPLPETATNISCALISKSKMLDGLQLSAGYCFIMPGTALMVVTNFYGIIYFNDTYYLGGKLGLNFIF